jgi:hypothetical protein
LRVSSRLIRVAERTGMIRHPDASASISASTPNHSNSITMQDVDAAFATACTACRALRDLCALSPELAAIITEAILDASSSSSSSSSNSNDQGQSAPGGVVASLASLLTYAIDESQKEECKFVSHTVLLCTIICMCVMCIYCTLCSAVKSALARAH